MQESTPTPESGVACLGEAMVLVAPDSTLHLAGAEANVAAGLAALDVPAAWVGRLGDDEFGTLIRTELQARGVDGRAIEVDPERPTGHYSKTTALDEHGEPRTDSLYSRAGSAASAMDPGFLDRPAVAELFGRAAVVHCSGITPALSDSCLALMRRLLRDRPGISGVVSFDVNWREQLWPDGDPRMVVELANLADLVLVGADEALRVLGTADPHELRLILPAPATVVVKDGAHRALAVDRNGRSIAVPALRVDVVEPVGAGDAFAAGYLSGVVRGEDQARCLRRGHIGAAATLTVAADSAPPPPAALLDALLHCSESDWAATSVTADGFALRGSGVNG